MTECEEPPKSVQNLQIIDIKAGNWRSSLWFITLGVVGYGITVDLLVYSTIVPVIPFQLQRLGYSEASSSALTGWLLFAYSLGLVLSTPPIAYLSEVIRSRQIFMIVGIVSLIGSTILFMEAPAYYVMVIARTIQGISSSFVWTVGMALLCDVTPKEKIGRQLGLAMVGLNVGFIVGPAAGGALFDRFGFRGPFVFCIIAAAVDGVGRLLIVEYRYEELPPTQMVTSDGIHGLPSVDTKESSDDTRLMEKEGQHLSGSRSTPLHILLAMLRSQKTMAAVFVAFVFGFMNSSLEPTMPLRLQAVWNLNPSQVGLVYFAPAVPTFVSGPLSGWIVDRYGVEVLQFVCLVSTIPWLMLMSLIWHLAFFVACLALQSFFFAGTLSPVMAELASISRIDPHIGFAHVYGGFNLAYGVGSFVGPLVAGQMYSHLENGWWIVLCVSSSTVLLAAVVSFCLTGERTLLSRFTALRILPSRIRNSSS